MRYLITILTITTVLFLSCNPITKRLQHYDVHGLDVSHYQSKINWDTVATQKIHFSFVKATEGETLIDSLYKSNWAEMKRVGIRRGAYHFFRPTVSPAKQAAHFIKQVKIESGDLPPVLDVEVMDGVSKEELVTAVKVWLDIVEEHFQTRVILYSNLNFYQDYLDNYFNNNPLWIARYHSKEPALRRGKQWAFWQYGNRGQLNGIIGDVDFNVFQGTLKELEEMCISEDTALSLLDK